MSDFPYEKYVKHWQWYAAIMLPVNVLIYLFGAFCAANLDFQLWGGEIRGFAAFLILATNSAFILNRICAK